MSKSVEPRNTDLRNAAAMLSLATRLTPPRRIPEVRITTHHPVLNGDRNFLRALRAAEMAAWEKGRLLGRTAPAESPAPLGHTFGTF